MINAEQKLTKYMRATQRLENARYKLEMLQDCSPASGIRTYYIKGSKHNPDVIGDKVVKIEELRQEIAELKDQQIDAMIYVLDLCKLVRDQNLRYGLLLQDVYINGTRLKDMNMKTYGIASSKVEMMHHDAVLLLAKILSEKQKTDAENEK